ncbi:hypothetical protein LINPERHAP1_LOCUS4180 [Linum perenne]
MLVQESRREEEPAPAAAVPAAAPPTARCMKLPAADNIKQKIHSRGDHDAIQSFNESMSSTLVIPQLNGSVGEDEFTEIKITEKEKSL